jgi:hypothetical protein
LKLGRPLILGIGGSGDIVGSSFVLNLLNRVYNLDGYLASISWERHVIDPVPGPIRTMEWRNANVVNDVIVEVDKNSYAVRLSNVIKPQAVKVSKVIGRNLYSVDNYQGPKRVAEGIYDLCNKLGITSIIGVDVGGDVLAEGKEEGLSSPLIDSISLASLEILRRMGINSILAVMSPGSDGELKISEIEERTSLIIKDGGYFGSLGFGKEDLPFMEKVLSEAETEASKIAYLALRGEFGNYEIRNRTKRVDIGLISTIVMFFSVESVYNFSPLAKAVFNTENVMEASKRLNDLGLYTEYDFEVDLFSLYGLEASKVDGNVINKIREEGKRRIKGGKPRGDI